MSDLDQDLPFTWEATQNAKGYFQIRVKLKSDAAEPTAELGKFFENNIKAAVVGIIAAGFKVQPEEPLKTEIKNGKVTKEPEKK